MYLVYCAHLFDEYSAHLFLLSFVVVWYMGCTASHMRLNSIVRKHSTFPCLLLSTFIIAGHVHQELHVLKQCDECVLQLRQHQQEGVVRGVLHASFLYVIWCVIFLYIHIMHFM